jgi:hypothetical protein
MDPIFSSLGICVPDILLPNPSIDLTRWAIIACDQYTSSREYWGKVETIIGEAPSTYHLVYPEIYLHNPDEENRISAIQRNMDTYLSRGVLTPAGPGFILVERTLAGGRRRFGLMAALDLECYDFSTDSHSLIRPTEGTILERIPPRLRIREGAALEVPHIMVLMDDPQGRVIEPLLEDKNQLPIVYDTDLMLAGGHVCGYHVKETKWIRRIADNLSAILKEAAQNENPLLFAVGDGNHSLATAKTYWDDLKKTLSPGQDHPARYALVELQNIHDPGIHFEPIHRVVFSANPASFRDEMQSFFEKNKCTVNMEHIDMSQLKERILPPSGDGIHHAALLYRGRCEHIGVSPGLHNLPAGTIQGFLDAYMEGNPRASIDYIHGGDTLSELSAKPDTVGVYLPPVSKQSFFDTIIAEGAMPQKTFSMGEAEEKRYYLECRRIRP